MSETQENAAVKDQQVDVSTSSLADLAARRAETDRVVRRIVRTGDPVLVASAFNSSI